MHNNHISATETASHFRLGSASVVLKWERIYYEEGPQALYKELCKRIKNMSLKNNKNENEDLLQEVQRLRMENEY